MTFRKIFIIPLVLVLISIVTIFLSFNIAKKIEDGYIYIGENDETPLYTGTHNALIGNISENDKYISTTQTPNGIKITIYDNSKEITKDYIFTPKVNGESYDSTIFIDFEPTEITEIKYLDNYIFQTDLNNSKIYDYTFVKTLDNVDTESMDLILFNIPDDMLSSKTLYETLSFTTLILSGFSFFTIMVAMYIKKS